MIKILFHLTILTSLLVSATPKQVEQYLTISHSEEELISLESAFSSMQNNFSKNADNNASYDIQLLSLRFRDYLERNISDDEMKEILANYNTVALLQFTSASQVEIDAKIAKTYIAMINDNSEETKRIELIDDICAKMYSKEAMIIMFDSLMKPLMQNGKGSENINDNFMKEQQKKYLEESVKEARNHTLYITKDFSIEDLEDLYKVAQTSAMDHEVKAVYAATAYALKDFFLSMASRYDIAKH